MSFFSKVVLVITIVLSFATGLFKVLQQKEDILLFAKIGIGTFGTTFLGILQIIGGIYLIYPKYRKIGSILLIGTYLLASIAVFANKMYIFGVVSILFILLPAFIYFNQKKISN